MNVTDAIVDRGLLPDPVLRAVVRRLLAARLTHERRGGVTLRRERQEQLRHELSHGLIAVATDDANDQHYEVPARFYELVLGDHLKYSSGYWPAGVTGLTASEEAMLSLTCARADLVDGQDVLELGCGWGSLTLWMAQRYPASTITAVSKSNSQREHIEKQAAVRGLDNVTVITCDINDLDVEAGSVDRVVSVEMFEHVRNHHELLRRIAGWLRPDGAAFVHHFAHRDTTYLFGSEEGRGGSDWMTRWFFTGGVMPADDHLLHLADHLAVDRHWVVDGTHYARTCNAWLARLDANRSEVRELFSDAYGRDVADAWVERWRVFFIACAELFDHGDGQEWWVTHLRLTPR